jgi:hypothetical protein
MFIAELKNQTMTRSEIGTPQFEQEYDLIVAGLGTAGAICAIKAAMLGLRVLGIEERDVPGGMATAGGITEYYGGAEGGLYQQIDKKAQDLARQPGFIEHRGIGSFFKSLALDDFCAKNQVVRVFSSVVTGVFLAGQSVVGIQYHDSGGLHAVRGAIVVDCTADGIVSRISGCLMRTGRHSDQSFQPFSDCLFLYRKEYACTAFQDSGYVNQYDVYDYSSQAVGAATQPLALRDKYSDDERILGFPAMLGVREGKTIVGRETLRLTDVLSGNLTDEPVFYGYANLDNHAKDTAYEADLVKKWICVCNLWSYFIKFPVPMGVLIPLNVSRLLAAGRHMSSEHDINSAFRMEIDMQKSGEAAAAMAYLAIRHNCEIHEISYADLKPLLLASECLKETDHFEIRGPMPEDSRHDLQLISDPDRLMKGLASTSPGWHIWSASKMPKEFDYYLCEWLMSDHKLLQYNSALALGLRENLCCQDVLMEMIRDQTGLTPTTSTTFNHPYAISAIILAGCLGLSAAIDPLLAILKDRAYPANIPFRTSSFIPDRDNLHFQFFSHAHAALLSIRIKAPETSERILSEIQKVLGNQEFKISIALNQNKRVNYNMTDRLVRMTGLA